MGHKYENKSLHKNSFTFYILKKTFVNIYLYSTLFSIENNSYEHVKIIDMQKVHKNGHKTANITDTLTIPVNHQNVDPIPQRNQP